MAHQQTKLCPACKQIFRARKDAVTCSARCRKRLHRAKLVIGQETKSLERSVESVVESTEKAVENLGSAIVEELTPSIATEEGYVATPNLAMPPPPAMPQPTTAAPTAAAPVPPLPPPGAAPTAPNLPVTGSTSLPSVAGSLTNAAPPPLNSYLQDPAPVSSAAPVMPTPPAAIAPASTQPAVEATPTAPSPAPEIEAMPPKVEDLPPPSLETVSHNAGDVFNPGGTAESTPVTSPVALQPEESLALASANPASSVFSSTATPLAEAPVSAIQQNLAVQQTTQKDFLASLKQAIKGRTAVYIRAAALIAIVSIGYFGFSGLFKGSKPPISPISSTTANSASATTVLPTNSNATSIQFNRATIVANGNPLTGTGQVTFQNQTNSANAFNLQDASGSSLINANTVNDTVTIKNVKVNGSLVAAGNISTAGSLQAGGGTSLTPGALVINSVTVCTSSGCSFNLPLTLTNQGNSFNGPNELLRLNSLGQVDNNLLGANLAFLNANQTFTGNNTFTGKVVFQNAVNGSSNFEIQKADGTGDLFMVDTSSGKIGIGRTPLASTNAILQVNGSIDLTGQVTFNGNQITTLNLADNSNIAKLNTNQTFTGNNTFSGNLSALNLQAASNTLTIGSLTSALALQGNMSSQWVATNNTFNTTIGFSGTPTGNVTYNFDASATPGTYTICTTVGNCVGSGGAVDTPGGGSGYLAKFTGSETIADSSILDNGLIVSVGLPTAFRASSDSATAFRVQNANGLVDLIVADTADSRVGISLPTGQVPAYPLDVAGDINSSSGLRVGGNLVCTSAGCSAVQGSGFFISNGTALQANANFNIQSAAIGSVVAALQGINGQTANLLNIKDGNGTLVFSVNNTGSVLLQPSLNSQSAFAVKSASPGNNSVLAVDTSNNRVAINQSTANYALDVNGDINVSSGSYFRINGVSICGPQATCAPSAGSPYYIQNGTTLQTGANFFISSANINNPAGILRGALGQVADVFDVQDGNQNNIFSVGATGSVLAKTTTNSVTGFQIQNSSAAALFVADTVNSKVGINTAVPGATLAVNGNGLFTSAAIGSLNPLTVSGNEITDASRAQNIQGDGEPVPSSDYGIWEGTTNLVTNGGFESGTSGWTSTGTMTISRDTSVSKFGTASLKITDPVGNNEAYFQPITTSSATYTLSMWIKGVAGTTIRLQGFGWGGGYIQTALPNNNWNRFTYTSSDTGGSSRGVSVWIRNNPGTIWVDGVQMEQLAYATPYVETNGATASRNAARVQVPTAGTINLTQSWIAARIYVPQFNSSYQGVFNIYDNNNYYIDGYLTGSTLNIQSHTSGYSLATTATISPGYHTAVFAWTSGTLYVSVDGSTFYSATDTTRPTGTLTSTFNIGTRGNGNYPLDGDFLWAATGTGTLTNTDAANIYAMGNTDPTTSSFSGAAAPTFVWQANNASYETSSRPIAFQVQNSAGVPLLALDASSANKLTVNAAAAYQNLTDSTNGFSIQNAAGNSNLFVADTADTHLGIGTGSPLTTLNVNGTGLIQGQSSASNSLTVSGNEITGATRAQNIQGDGETSPSSDYGIWEGTTNLITNGGFESNTNGWTAIRGASLNRVTTTSKFGSSAMQITTNSSQNNQTAEFNSYSVTNGQSYTLSFWAKGAVGGESVIVGVQQGSGEPNQTFTLTNQWARYSFTVTAGSTVSGEFLEIGGNGTVTENFYVDGVQLEQKAYATPYVETNGATASRSGASVTVPTAGILNATQGWYAARMQYGATGTNRSAAGGMLFGDGTNGILVYYTGTTTWWIYSIINGTLSLDPAFVSITQPAVGNMVTVVAAWNANNNYLSINGSGFVSTARSHGIPAITTQTLNIGNVPFIVNGQWDGDILWSAAGTGTLTNTDASSINNFGNTDPYITNFSQASYPTMVWHANNATYQTGNSLAFQVQNSSGGNLLNVNSANNALVVNTNTSTFKDTADSTNAFAIQNAAGNSNLFIADTADSRLGVATATPLTTFNVSGTGLFQGQSSASNSLTVSGNEITDSTRTIDQQGDGRAAPDSSYGIWESTTNLVTNGGFESNTTGWVTQGGVGTITRDTSTSKFGAASAHVTVPANESTYGPEIGNGGNIPVSPNTTYTVSAWMEGSGSIWLRTSQFTAGNGTGSYISDLTSSTFTLNNTWTRYTYTLTTGSSTNGLNLQVITANTNAADFYVDGVQLEQKAYATPYVETNGATATRSGAWAQAPSALLNATQGWFAERIRMGVSSATLTSVNNNARFFMWGTADGGPSEQIFYNAGNGTLRMFQDNNTNGTGVNQTVSWNAGDTLTIVGAWTASTLYISVNGTAFTSTASGWTPAGLPPLFSIGTNGVGTETADGDVMWAASGTGTLTNTDAASMYNLGNTDPYITNFSQASYPTMVWHANNATYQTPTNLALQVQNSLGNNLLALDSANSSLTVAASTKLQNLTDSTNALTVNNAQGQTLFNVNTSNLQVSVANLQSSGSVNIVNPQGSISLSPGISSPNSLAVSGNEITDAERAIGASTTNTAGQSYDGKTNDSSMGIWESTTNLITNGGFESNTGNWADEEAGTPSSVVEARSTSFAKFGSASLQYSFVSNGTSDAGATSGKLGTTAQAMAVSASTAYTASAWVYAASKAGSTGGQLQIIWYTSGGTLISRSTVSTSWSVGSWARYINTATSPSNAAYAYIKIDSGTATTNGGTFTMYIDGVQFEQKAYATPYVETNGAAATRNIPGVQGPASLLNASTGWFAASLRMGWSTSAEPSDGLYPTILDWRNDNNNKLSLFFNQASNQWTLQRVSGGSGVSVYSSSQSFNAGSFVTVVATWTPTQLSISINGSPFVSIASNLVPALTASLFNVGSTGSSNRIDSDIFWTATGTGTLTNSDAATLNNFGNTDPTFAGLLALNRGAASPTMVWNGSTAAYQDSTSSNGDSLIYAANTSATLTGNLIDLQSGSVPSSKFNVDTSGNTTIAGNLSVGGLSTFNGSAFKPTADSTAAFQIQNAAGTTTLFNANTTANQISLGSGANPTTLVVGVSSSSSDPSSPTNGEIYYNTSMNSFRCYQAGVWVNCVGAGGGGGSGNVSQGGNSFGANMVLGTNDNYSLALRTDGTNVMTLAANGSALFQNSANSTSAFQIQNVAGTSNLLVADTTNSRIGIGTASPTSTLSVNGSTTVQQSTVTSPLLTVSGNEITDATRTANTQGDGETPPTSDYGIWEGTTNLITNGGFESNTNGWSTTSSWFNNAGATLTQDTTTSKFGSGSGRVVTPGSTTQEGVHTTNISVTSGQQYTFSVWLKGSGTVNIGLGGSGLGSVNSSVITLSSTWTRYAVTLSATGTGSGPAAIYTSTTQATTFWIDGAQVEQKPIATPYVETNGATASRNAANVTGPSSIMNSAQGWVALNVRPGWASTATPNGYMNLWGWGDSTSADIDIYYSSSGFIVERCASTCSTASVASSFAAGVTKTVVVSWTSTQVKISVDGSNFTSNNNTTIPAISSSTFQIGGQSTFNSAVKALDGDFLWAASGTGTLTNTDASNINAFGNTDPSFGSFSGPSSPTMVWAANNASYSNSAASSSLVFNVQNSSGTNLLGVDATANQVTANTSALFKNGVNSTTAFQIQNAGGNNLLSVDTINNQVNLGTPGSSGVNGQVVFNSATSNNYAVTLGVSSSQAASYTLNLPTAAPTAGQCLQVDATTATQLDFVTCSGGGGGATDLQGAYNNATSPATIATTSAAKGIIFKGGSGNDSTTLFQVQNSGGTAVLDVDTVNGRVGVGTNSPVARLDVASGTQTVIRGNSTGSNDILDLASNGTNAFTVGSTGAVLAQNTTDSTGAFKIQNAAGTSNLFVADTADSRLGIGTATPVATVNVAGSTLIQQGSATNLTVSGNEITDATRTTNTQGDGRAAPDSSYGIWESTTNLVTNGGFESGTSGWVTFGGTTIAQTTAQSKFGSSSLQATSTAAGSGFEYALSGLTASTTYTGSVWIYRTETASTITLTLRNAANTGAIASTTVPATLGWQRVIVSGTTDGTNTRLRVTLGSSAVTAYFDGAQIEQKAYATPYVDTNGSTASRSAASVQGPASALNLNQGWVAIRFRAGVSNTTTGHLFSWYPNGGNSVGLRFYYGATSGTQWGLYRSDGTNTYAYNPSDGTINPGDLNTVIFAWTSNSLALSVNGGVFISTTIGAYNGTNSGGNFNIGYDAYSGFSQQYLDGDTLWFAAGTGTLSNTDATNLYAFGSTDPNVNSFAGTADPTMVWKANNANYVTSSNADVAFQVNNASGSSLLSLNATNSQLTVNAAGLIQTTTNSNNAFEVATSGGTNLFNVNTNNLQVSAANLQSSGAVNLTNANGTVSLAGSLQSTNTLTTSGNEITDATRTTNTQGDGRAAPDSSYGIWESTTNLVTNGGFESNLNTWAADTGSGGTITRNTSNSKFGSASMEITTAANKQTYGASIQSPYITASASTTYTFSFWAKANGVGGVVRGSELEYNSGLSLVQTQNGTNLTLTSTWTRYTYTFTTSATTAYVQPAIQNASSTAALDVLIDGVQLEQKAIATPYVETNGATATRNAARVQGPATDLNATQGWVSERVRFPYANGVMPSSSQRLFEWGNDGSNRINLIINPNNGALQLNSQVAGSGATLTTAAQTWAAGSTNTITAYWTATTLAISWNGGAYYTAARTAIPSLTASSFFIGSDLTSSNQIDSDVMWTAAGTGTLSNTDATNLYNLGSTDPSLANLYSLNSGSANPTFVWNANNANYQDATSSNGQASIYAANTSGATTGNLIDLQSGTYPSSRFSVDVNGRTTIQTSTNNTAAFQIQNSSGSPVLLADTVNNQVGINTSTPTATLAVVGTGLIQASSATNPTLTVSGNEITDATRTTNTQGDGRAAPDSSYGIWEGTTNLVTNGGFESGTSGWSLTNNSGGATSSWTASTAKFGSASIKLTDSNANADDRYQTASDIPVSASTTYTFSAWVNASGFTAGATSNRLLLVTDQTGQGFASTTLTSATNGWTRQSVTFTTLSNTSGVALAINAPQGTIYIDGVQLEQKAYATPYVETNGATATRNAARVQASSSVLSSTQGWAAFRIRPGFSSTASGDKTLLKWYDDNNHLIQVYWNASNSAWRIDEGSSTGTTQVLQSGQSFNAGDLITVIAQWTPSGTATVSVNGGSFGGTSVPVGTPTAPVISNSLFDIGSAAATSQNYFDGDILWTAAGKGTLTNTDAANINNLGNTDPGFSTFPGYSTPTMVWQANTSSYINSSTSSNLVFNVQNSSGQSLFNVDTNLSSVNLQQATSATSALTFGNDTTANLYRSAAGTIATSGSLSVAGNLSLQGPSLQKVSSAIALQIQNAAGTNLMVADTVNSKIGIGAAPSAAATAATFQVAGNASVQQTASAGAMTLSGNEITDVTRTTNTQGDGRAAPDSSYGIWEGTTNLITNGGMESSATGWTTGGTNTVVQDTTKAKFGSASLKATYQNNIQLALFNNITVTSGQTYTASAWVYVPISYNGTQPQLEIDGSTAVINLALRNQWQRVSVTYTASSSSDNLAIVERGSVPSAGQSIWIDGAQLENKPIATPYVDTNGATATRNAASVQAPARNLNATQGWVAMRVRLDYAQTSSVYHDFFQWGDNSSNFLEIYYDRVSQQFSVQRFASGAGNFQLAPLVSFAQGGTATLIFAWTASSISVSVNGASFTAKANTNVPSLASTLFSIGKDTLGSNGYADSDVFWTATGTGTLSNTDATAINNLGNSDPDVTFFSSQDSASTPTMVWKANDANYQTNLNFSVQNSSGSGLLSVDNADGAVLLQNATSSATALLLGRDADLYRSSAQTLKTDGNLTVGTNLTVNGSVLLQNATDSASAFQINNASGSTLLGVDTLHSTVAIGTTPSTADTLTIKGTNGNGTSSIQLQRADNGVNTLKISVSPQATIFAEGVPLYIDASSNNSVQIGNVSGGNHSAAAPTLIVQGVASQTADIIQVQNSNGHNLAGVDANGKLQFADGSGAAYDTNLYRSGTGTLKTDNSLVVGTNLTANGTALFKNASDSTSAVQIQNAAGTSNLFVADTTNSRIAIDQASAAYALDVGGDINSTGTLRINGAQISTASLSDGSNIGLLNANNTFSGNNTFTGTVLAKNTTNSTAAFQIQNSTSGQLFVADTADMRIYIGNPAGDTTTGTLLVLDNISNSGDPAGINGAMYYNSTTGKFRCYEAGNWTDCLYASQIATTSSSQNVTSTSYGDITGLGFNVVAGKNYILQCTLLVSVTGNGSNVSMTGPASPTNYTATFQKTSDQSAGDTFTTSSSYDDSNNSTAFRVVTSTAGANKFILTYNAVLNNGANAGSWQLRAKAVDGSSSITFYPTSTCNLRPF